eukprot:CAMPEP_0172454404 /NCGR_PEP_ID=MMETSP1065-20121228/11404_1 /TAXON_ID=265537 /ORGANISM="Amphiprora paludosa, Strain CCMP125" /LENGTH=58 /DNA_ID=CAMNT_0013206727 /DNA_START=114 /DNA_END=287 /DNA_ORIENTATION=-
MTTKLVIRNRADTLLFPKRRESHDDESCFVSHEEEDTNVLLLEFKVADEFLIKEKDAE